LPKLFSCRSRPFPSGNAGKTQARFRFEKTGDHPFPTDGEDIFVILPAGRFSWKKVMVPDKKERVVQGNQVPENVWRHAVGGGSVKVGKNREKRTMSVWERKEVQEMLSGT
jgi:hypothetical protein